MLNILAEVTDFLAELEIALASTDSDDVLATLDANLCKEELIEETADALANLIELIEAETLELTVAVLFTKRMLDIFDDILVAFDLFNLEESSKEERRDAELSTETKEAEAVDLIDLMTGDVIDLAETLLFDAADLTELLRADKEDFAELKEVEADDLCKLMLAETELLIELAFTLALLVFEAALEFLTVAFA